MGELRLRALWWSLGLALLATIAALSLLPLKALPVDVPNIDKLNHAVAYIVLTTYFGQLTTLPRALGVLLGYGIGIELLQAQTPYRQAEIADLVANSVGMVLGLLLLRTRIRRSLRWCESFVA